jgi:hypothetical protein
MSQAADAIGYAQAQEGKPYQFGAAGPNAFDCSGLIVAAYSHANPPVHLTHYTGAMIFEGLPVSQANLQPGDLVFPEPTHVQLYLGDGQVIDAPHAGATVHSHAMTGFWQGRRVVTDGKTVTEHSLPAMAASIGDASKVLDPFGILKTSDTAESLKKVLTTLTDGNFFKRVGLFVLGITLAAIGVAILLIAIVRKPAKIAAGVGADVGMTIVRARALQKTGLLFPNYGGQATASHRPQHRARSASGAPRVVDETATSSRSGRHRAPASENPPQPKYYKGD